MNGEAGYESAGAETPTTRHDLYLSKRPGEFRLPFSV
jgi:hypothetical protein